MEIGTGKKKMGLSTQIFIALLAGAICGVCVHYFLKEGYFRDTILVGGVFYVLGQGFIRLMQMLVVPLVLCSLVCGSMSIGDTKTLGKVGGKAILFYLCTTALAIIVALGIALMIDPGTGVAMENVSKADIGNTEQVSMADTLLNIIPKNPIGAMANGDMLPIIVFALFIGVLLAKMGNRASTLSNFFAQFNDLMMEMTMAVMKVAPIGVFCLIAKTFAEIGFDAFLPMLKYMGAVTLALAVQCLVVYQLLLFVFTRLNPLRFLKRFSPVMMFAFTTATSNATIPLSIDTLDKKNRGFQENLILYDPAGSDYQHGWNLDNAGGRGYFHCAGVRHGTYPGPASDRYCNCDDRIHRNGRDPVSWTDHAGHGIDLSWTSDRRHRTHNGDRPYFRYASDGSKHYRRCGLHHYSFIAEQRTGSEYF